MVNPISLPLFSGTPPFDDDQPISIPLQQANRIMQVPTVADLLWQNWTGAFLLKERRSSSLTPMTGDS